METEFKPVIASVCGYSLCSGSSGSHMQQEDVDSMQEDSPMVNKGEPVPKKAKNPRPLQCGPSPERLLAHANALINRVSSFVTKPVNAKYGNKGMRITGEKPNRNVEMASASTELSLPVETDDTSTHDKLTYTIRCKICKEPFGSIKELNEHHQVDHGVVDCEQ